MQGRGPGRFEKAASDERDGTVITVVRQERTLPADFGFPFPRFVELNWRTVDQPSHEIAADEEVRQDSFEA